MASSVASAREMERWARERREASQRTVPVKQNDTASDLASRVFEAECEAYPTALQWLASGRIAVNDRKVVIS